MLVNSSSEVAHGNPFRLIKKSSSHTSFFLVREWDREYKRDIIGKTEEAPYQKPQLSCLKHRSPRYKPHNSAACRSLNQEQVLAQFGHPDFSETIMVDSQPNQDAGSTPSSGQILQAINILQGHMMDLSAQAKQDRALLRATHDKLYVLSKDHGHLDGQFTETMGLVEGSLQQTQQELEQTTNILHEKIELSSSQSNDEEFPLDEHTSKEEATLSINDKEPEVEADEIMDNNLILKFHVVPQKDELEGMTEQSTLEEAIGSNTDGEPQLHKRFDRANNLHVRYEYS
ncbi:hypothetical protein ACLB2K_025733 [Fragaria x ananassa]